MPSRASSSTTSNTSRTISGVEGGGDFVEQDDFGIQAQGAHDGDALLLSARKFARVGVFPLQQADAGQQFVGLRFRLGTVAFLYLQRAEQDVVDNGHVGEQLVALEYHAYFLPRRLPRYVLAEHARALHFDAAALMLFQAVDAAQQGGLAAAGRAEQDDDFPFGQIQIQRTDGGYAAVFFVQFAHA
ncbi:hypothetical protein NEIELOOT_01974 [Neisseria elongata subsp. glycolytica ATCC 29315]|uniref:Uncharacterized protein n=1 Tax=Neisseria elongata subsp. glycolytica ATCC 29315 TaxID=546263 RepID=D4DSD1_NEIEG|nr:hypothetical protein NEIELOOT_01974 [Neisseria elongata subsp. glycolytica ATCC 29315]